MSESLKFYPKLFKVGQSSQNKTENVHNFPKKLTSDCKVIANGQNWSNNKKMAKSC